MLRRIALIPILVLAAATAVVAALGKASSFRSPLDGSSVPVSSFGEYRPDHLHPGVDLSTGGRTGLPVFAVADGEIYRLKVEWRGYGRALYLRHPEGRISVYGHLDRFDEAVLHLEGRVTDARLARSTPYPGDIYLDPPIRVRRGQRIATSGESGAGLPHLHFELRRDEQRPADPSPALGRMKPDLSLRFDTLYLVPIGPETLFQGERRAEVSLARDASGAFLPSKPLMVTGPFLPEASVVVEDGSGHRFGVSGISTRVDGRLVYESLLKDFRFDEYPQVGLLLDHALSSMAPSLFVYRFARLPGNSLGRVANVTEAPWPDLRPGSHRIEMSFTGAFGGSAKASIPFTLVAAPRLQWSPEKSEEDGSVRLALRWDGADPATLPRLRAVYTRTGNASPLECRNRLPLTAGESCSFDSGDLTPGIIATVLLGELPVARSLRLAQPLLDTPPEAPPLRVRPGIDSVDFEIASQRPESPLPSRLIFREGERETARDFVPRRSGSLEATLSLAAWKRVQEVMLEWPASPRPLRSRISLAPHVGDPLSGLILRDCGIRLELPARSLFSSTALACEIEDHPPRLPGEGILLRSRLVRFLPEGLPFAIKARLVFPRPEATEHPERVGIYRVDSRRGGWTFLGGETKEAEVSLSIGRLDSYALLEDGSPPVILEILPAPGTVLGDSHPHFSVRVEDTGTGLNYDAVHLQVDGKEWEMEFDPDRGRASGSPSQGLSPGTHAVRLWAVDRAGNRTPVKSFEVSLR